MGATHFHSGRASLRLIRRKQECKACDTQLLCQETWRDRVVMRDVSTLVESKGPYETGERIYKIQDKYKSLFIIKSGIVKLEKVDNDGNSHISGFHFPGDLIGLESIGDKQYSYNAIALEKTWVCEIPLDSLKSLGQSIISVQQTMISLLGKRVHQTDDMLTQVRYLSSEQRLLIFIEMLCKRYFIQTIDSKKKLHLPMSKGDIASYLGMRPESVSRALRNLQNQGVIHNHLKSIEIKDLNVAKKMICKS